MMRRRCCWWNLSHGGSGVNLASNVPRCTQPSRHLARAHLMFRGIGLVRPTEACCPRAGGCGQAGRPKGVGVFASARPEAAGRGRRQMAGTSHREIQTRRRKPAIRRYAGARFSSAPGRTGDGVRRAKAALSSGCKPRPATAPAGSNRSNYGGNEVVEACVQRRLA